MKKKFVLKIKNLKKAKNPKNNNKKEQPNLKT